MTNGRPDTPPERFTWGRELSSAILRRRCQGKTPNSSYIAAEATAQPWPPTRCGRWATPMRFRWMADGGLIRRPGCRQRSKLKAHQHRGRHVEHDAQRSDFEVLHHAGQA